MDSLLPQLLSFPPHPAPAEAPSDAEYDKQIKGIVQTLSSISANKLTGGVRGGGDLLDIIDPSINTLPYLYVLLAHISATSGKESNKSPSVSSAFSPTEPLWHKMVVFMDRFDTVQIRYGGNEIRRLIELTAFRAQQLQQTTKAILPIRTAILRIDPSGATFTSSHLILVTLCLEAHSFAPALPVLDRAVSFVPVSSEKQAEASINALSPYLCSNHESSSNYINSASGISDRLTYQDPLLYFFYGAMIYMALKEWERALYLLENVLGVPTARDNVGGTSRIQVEAYKKWVLVGLLHKGHMLRTPKNISTHTLRAYHTLAKPYTNLAEIFRNGIKNEESDSKVIAEVQYAHNHWRDGSNEGLVKRVIRAYRRYSVQHLEQTYTALTVGDVTHRTSPDLNNYSETAKYLSDLISTGQLKATISRPSDNPMTWVIRFNSSIGEGSTEEQQCDALKKQAEKIAALMDDVREADRQLGLSKEYIQDAKKTKKARENGQSDENAVQGSLLNQELFAQDEDMMEDL